MVKPEVVLAQTLSVGSVQASYKYNCGYGHRLRVKTLVSRLGVIGERGRDQARKKNLFERESKILE